MTIELTGGEFIDVLKALPKQRDRAKLFNRATRRPSDGNSDDEVFAFDERITELSNQGA